ncbi:hypothetical protein Glove_99g316 [Diversispora epigaea]|uniref:Uncharacterized protein n=1 Tax=Diversispora epigaea TaxID=1348612 RepID=A0A397JDH2_9GLOM|nr:hypothetical protein Glove_99g316 [Diversispora epigaea]
MQREEGEKGPITGRSVSDIEETTAKKLEPVFTESDSWLIQQNSSILSTRNQINS